MNEMMECMCLDCGISNYLDVQDVSLENIPDLQRQFVKNRPCIECGGALVVIGRAGEEPCYTV